MQLSTELQRLLLLVVDAADTHTRRLRIDVRGTTSGLSQQTQNAMISFLALFVHNLPPTIAIAFRRQTDRSLWPVWLPFSE